MPQPNDLSRSLVALDHNSTIIPVIEMSQSSWLVGGVLPGIERQPRKCPTVSRRDAARRRRAAAAAPVPAAPHRDGPCRRGRQRPRAPPPRRPGPARRWRGRSPIEPQPGGLYLVNVTGARFARGSFREVVPVHRLAYSFGWDGSEVVPPGSSLVEIDLIEQPDGTLLRLTHTGLPNAEQCAGHAEGWAHYLGRLAEVAAGRDPGPDPWRGRTGKE
jgi:uncharacterized protein YndB with AHSA1/START domain